MLDVIACGGCYKADGKEMTMAEYKLASETAWGIVSSPRENHSENKLLKQVVPWLHAILRNIPLPQLRWTTSYIRFKEVPFPY